MLKNVQHMAGKIPKEAFIMLEKIGEGAFGNVHKGALFQGGVNTLVAIKELKVGAGGMAHVAQIYIYICIYTSGAQASQSRSAS